MRNAIAILVLMACAAFASQDVTKAEARQAKADFAAQQSSQKANQRATKRVAKDQRKAMKRLSKGGRVKVKSSKTRARR